MEGQQKPSESIDTYVASLTPEEKKAMSILFEERIRLKKTWEELRQDYQRTAEQMVLFSQLHADLYRDIERIERLSGLEQQYGDISKYFNGRNGH
jgi:hypothetical protein